MKNYYGIINEIYNIFKYQDDKTVENHSRVVASLAVQIATESLTDNIILKNDFIDMAYLVGLTHDLGKLSLPGVESSLIDVDHSFISATILKEILERNKVDKYYIDQMIPAVKHHSEKEKYDEYELLDQILIEADILAKLSPIYLLSLFDNNYTTKENINKINKYVKEKAINLNGLIKTKIGKRIYGKLYQTYCNMRLSVQNCTK